VSPPADSGAGYQYQASPQYAQYAQYYQQYQWPPAYYRPQPAPRPRKSRTALIIIVVVCGVVLLGGMMLVVMTMSMGGGDFGPVVGDTIALVRIEGIIAESAGGGPFGFGYESGTQAIVDQLERAGRDGSVKAVVIRINSPGGSAAASQEIYTAVKRLQKPVVVSMGDVAASGGYYVAAGADKIVANPATLTGSIGVIMQSFNLAGLLGRYGVQADTIKSGPFKDTGSMFRPMAAPERQYLQSMVNDVYDQFVRAVAEGRKLDVAYVKKLADGRVFTGQQALQYKLVDELGGLRHAIEVAKKQAGIAGPAHVRELRRKSFFEEMMGSQYGAKGDVAWRMLEYERANPARHLLEAPMPSPQ